MHFGDKPRFRLGWLLWAATDFYFGMRSVELFVTLLVLLQIACDGLKNSRIPQSSRDFLALALNDPAALQAAILSKPVVSSSITKSSSVPFVTVWTSENTPWSQWGGYAGQRYTSDNEGGSVTNAAQTPLGNISVRGNFSSVIGVEGGDRYVVRITGGTWTHPLLPLFKLPLPIRGVGYLSVLYADESVRVLQNYRDTQGAIAWESEGGIAVQVRYDLVPDVPSNFVDAFEV